MIVSINVNVNININNININFKQFMNVYDCLQIILTNTLTLSLTLKIINGYGCQ